MDRSNHVIHFPCHSLIERKCFFVVIKIAVDIFGDRNVVSEKMTVQIHNVNFATLKKAYTVDFFGPGVADTEILVVADIFILRIEHGRKVIRGSEQLQSGFLSGTNIFQNCGISMPGV